MIHSPCCPLQTGNREEVLVMEQILVSFLVSVGAGVVSYYICKWLDRDRKGR